MDVVVIGGGIVGVASAYALCQREANVTVVERGNIGAGNTERSAGGIRTQFASAENVTLATESLGTWGRFESAFGTDIDFRRSGYLFVVRTDEMAEQFRRNVDTQRSLGVDNEFLSPGEVVGVCPGLREEAITGGAYSPNDGLADPHLALQGYATAARDAGTDIRLHTPVTDIIRRDGAVTAVETDDDRLAADMVVNAAGAWAGQIAEMADITLPLTPQRLGIALIDPDRSVGDAVPMTLNPESDCYFHPERNGRALLGGGPELTKDTGAVDVDRVSTPLDMAFVTEALERVSEFTDYFGPDSRIHDGWTGVICSTPDHDPIIEETIPGFVNAVGFSGHGFMLAPAVGRLVAELTVDGTASIVDADAYRSDRFHDDENGHRWVSA